MRHRTSPLAPHTRGTAKQCEPREIDSEQGSGYILSVLNRTLDASGTHQMRNEHTIEVGSTLHATYEADSNMLWNRCAHSKAASNFANIELIPGSRRLSKLTRAISSRAPTHSRCSALHSESRGNIEQSVPHEEEEARPLLRVSPI
jgi:hypothetical protein